MHNNRCGNCRKSLENSHVIISLITARETMYLYGGLKGKFVFWRCTGGGGVAGAFCMRYRGQIPRSSVKTGRSSPNMRTRLNTALQYIRTVVINWSRDLDQRIRNINHRTLLQRLKPAIIHCTNDKHVPQPTSRHDNFCPYRFISIEKPLWDVPRRKKGHAHLRHEYKTSSREFFIL